jgi:NitT/TauT family transport system permease protein
MNKNVSKHVTRYCGILIVFIVICIIWYIFSYFINKAFFPNPFIVFKTVISLINSGVLFVHLKASLSRICWTLLLSFIPAIIIGIAAGRSAKINAVISPMLYITHPLPKAAFLPLIMLFFGIGEASKIVLLSFTVFGQIILAARDSVHRISQTYIDSVYSLGANRIQLIRHVIIPAILPDLFTSLRVSLGTIMAVLFLAETFASSSGLGFLIVDAWNRIAYPEMYAAILALSFLGLVLFILADIAEKIICPWR